MNTTYSRDRSGPQALTVVQLPEQRELHIRTAKASSGVLTTRAAVHKREGAFLKHAFGLGIDGIGDFSKVVAQRSIARITERAVEQLHASATEHLPSIRVAVEQHYALQAERAAASKAAHA